MNEQACANCVYFQIDIGAKNALEFNAVKECQYRLPYWAAKQPGVFSSQSPDTDGQVCEVFIERKEVTE